MSTSIHSHQNEPKLPLLYKLWLYVRSFKDYEKVILSIIFLTGTCLCFIGLNLEHSNESLGRLISSFAIILTLESLASAINHFILHRKYKEELKSEVLKAFENKAAQLKQEILEQLKLITAESNARLLSSLRHSIYEVQKTRSLGIVNLEKGLNMDRIIDKLKRTTNDTLSLQRLYFSENEFNALKKNVLSLVENNNHTIQILLLAPVEQSTIKRRLKHLCEDDESLINDALKIMYSIRFQLAQLYALKKLLPPDKRDQLQIKFHNNLVVASFTAYEDKIIHCSYLNNRTADEGINITVKGKETDFYKEWLSHFESDWNNATFFEVANGKFSNIAYPGQNATVRKTKTLEECLSG